MPGRSGRDDMQGVKSYGAPLGPAASNGPVQRNVPRQATDDQIHQAIQQQHADAVRSARAGQYQGKPPAPSTPGPSPTRDLSVLGAAQKIAGRGQQVDQAVDDAS